jgi:hypothetical protein
MPGPTDVGVPRGARRGARELLLHSFAAAAAAQASAWPQVLEREAVRHGLEWLWRGALAEEPTTAAVRVAHALDMGRSGMQAWTAAWPAQLESASLQFAAAAAGLLAGRDALLVLAAAMDGSDEDAAALVDGESCARMTVAGFDPETELRLGNCAELLASAGDLVSVPARAGAGAVSQYLILGLKWHAPAGD